MGRAGGNGFVAKDCWLRQIQRQRRVRYNGHCLQLLVASRRVERLETLGKVLIVPVTACKAVASKRAPELWRQRNASVVNVEHGGRLERHRIGPARDALSSVRLCWVTWTRSLTGSRGSKSEIEWGKRACNGMCDAFLTGSLPIDPDKTSEIK